MTKVRRGDPRDRRTWVVLELSRIGELKLEEGVIETLLRDLLKLDADHPIYLPSIRYRTSSFDVSLQVMEGYVFVASGLPDSSYYNLEQTPYIRRVLSTRDPVTGMRVLQTLRDSDVESLKEQMASSITNDLAPGMKVRVVDGLYSNLEACIYEIEEDGKHAQIGIVLRSLDLIARVPCVCLVPSEGTS